MTKKKKSRKQSDIDRVARHLYHEYVKEHKKEGEKHKDALKRISESLDFQIFKKQTKSMKKEKKDKFDKIFNKLKKKAEKRKSKKKKDSSEGETKKKKKKKK